MRAETGGVRAIPLDSLGPRPGQQRQMGDQPRGFQPLERPGVEFPIQFVAQRMFAQVQRGQWRGRWVGGV
jgi:hypothetical protein